MHMYGVVDACHTTRQAFRITETGGFFGMEAYPHSGQHVDSRGQCPSYGSGRGGGRAT
ncbi:hypothetical protein [Streptomyces sp. NPDC006012]|uniref:hypothetical protein n=1 Tax=Streptomyces sp. NPDC006012 TaxID=3364739 RepID=UPI0036BDEA51